MTNRVAAIAICALGIGVLVALALNVPRLNLGFSLAFALPDGTPEKEAAIAAGQGFAPGIVSPTMLEVTSDGSTPLDTEHLAALESAIGRQPGVAGVVGPRALQELLHLPA